MKVAILFFGRINFNDILRKHITNYTNNSEDYDIFCSTDAPPAEEVQEFINRYSPKAICCEKIEKPIIPAGFQAPYYYNVFYHLTNKKRVFELFEAYCNETNSVYDYVIMTRMDLLLKNPIPLDTLTLYNDRTIYIPGGFDGSFGIYFAITDIMGVGSFNSIKKYSLGIDNFFRYLNITGTISPELFTNLNICEHGLHVQRFTLEYTIIRSVESYQQNSG